MRNRIAGALLIAALAALSPGFALADESDASIEQLIVNSAQSPADHAALAKYYRGKAEAARASATNHQSMARSYTGGKMAQREQMAGHCKKIAKENTEIAAQYDDLAKLHEAQAKKPQ